MSYRTLISATELQTLMASSRSWVVLDCSFDLSNPAAGEQACAAGHVPGAQYAHLDRDLAGPKATAGTPSKGRHPLPSREALAATVGRWGITPATQVVTLDAQGGPYAARAWWLLQWLGHADVAVLDGGVAAWLAAGGTLSTDTTAVAAAPPYPATAPAMPTIDAAALQATLGRRPLIDARAAERFRGDAEPLDPVAGHIPGALNRPFKDNLQSDGRFKPAESLRADFHALLGAVAAAEVVHQCGSGVTACHNLLAMAHAGLPGATLYPGSWSQWCADPERPVARG